jgi:hypothetical protein
MRDGLHRANRFAGVATYADFRIYEVLFDDFGIHISIDFKTANAAAPGCPKQGTAPTGGSAVREATSVGVSSFS